MALHHNTPSYRVLDGSGFLPMAKTNHRKHHNIRVDNTDSSEDRRGARANRYTHKAAIRNLRAHECAELS